MLFQPKSSNLLCIYKDLSDSLRTMEKQKSEVKKQIICLMGCNKELRIGEHKAVLLQSIRLILDSLKVKDALGEQFSLYQKSIPVTEIKIL